MRSLQTIAESTQRLSDDLKASIADVDWRALSGFRNVLVHDYLGGIDLERVWDAIAHDLPSDRKSNETDGRGIGSRVKQLTL